MQQLQVGPRDPVLNLDHLTGTARAAVSVQLFSDPGRQRLETFFGVEFFSWGLFGWLIHCWWVPIHQTRTWSHGTTKLVLLQEDIPKPPTVAAYFTRGSADIR